MTSQVTLRAIRSGDGPELEETFRQSIEGLASGHYGDDQMNAWRSRISPTALEVRMLSTVAFAAESEGHIVGFASLDPHNFELDFLYVRPEFARQGIGRALTAEVEDAARLRGIEGLELTASLNAVVAYERMGYRRVRDLTRTIDGIRVPCVRMSKRLL